MRFSPWLLASNSTLAPPRELYLRTEEIQSIMADKALYLDYSLKNQDFIRTLCLQTTLAFADFLKEFRKWRAETEFGTSLGHIVAVYHYLRQHLLRTEHTTEKSELLLNPFFFLPNKINRAPHQMQIENESVKGRFYHIDQVCWEDPTGLISKDTGTSTSRRILQDFYFRTQETQLKDFFLTFICVERFPPAREYLSMVGSIAEKTSLPDQAAIRKILRLFEVLGSLCILQETKEHLYQNWRFEDKFQKNLQFYNQDIPKYQNQKHSSDVAETCKHYEKLFPTHKNRFTRMKSDTGQSPPILVFNKNLAEIFTRNERVDFIFIDEIWSVIEKRIRDQSNQRFIRGDSQLLKILFFFKACGLPTLTDLYEHPNINPEQISKGCYGWEKSLHEATPYIQRFLHSKHYQHYQRLQGMRFADYLNHSTFFATERFEVVYLLKNRRDVVITKEKFAHVEHSLLDGDSSKKATVYVIKSKSEEANDDDVTRELVNLFVPNNDVELAEELYDFWCSLFIETNKELFMTRRKRINQLPMTEVPWEFPRPPDPFVSITLKVLFENVTGLFYRESIHEIVWIICT